MRPAFANLVGTTAFYTGCSKTLSCAVRRDQVEATLDKYLGQFNSPALVPLAHAQKSNALSRQNDA